MIDNIIISQYIAALKGIVEVDVVYGGQNDVLLRGDFGAFGKLSSLDILNRIKGLPGKAEITSIDPKVVIRIRMPGKIAVHKIPWLNAILFLLTLLSTLMVGAIYADVGFAEHLDMLWKEPLKVLISGMPFSFSLLGILLFHEFGHYIASRIHGVQVTLPYFIPAPTIIGTLGAVIRLKSPFITRKQLFDVGAAGPLAGMLVAIPVSIWGLAHPVFIRDPGSMGGMLNLGDSLLFSWIASAVGSAPPPGYIVSLNPVAFAGWVGFLVTMLNLLPIGQLDGGHILYAMFGKVQHKVAALTIALLVVMSYWWLGWIFWALIGLFLIKIKHPPTILDDVPLDKTRLAIGFVCIIVFVLCFIPIPASELY